MMSYVESNQRYGIIEAVIHLVNRDFKSLASLYQRMGFIPDDVDTRPIIVALEDALPEVLNASVGELNFKNVINKLGDVMYKFPFSLPPYYIAIIRCLGVLEGLAIQVRPESRIIQDAYPYIASRLLTDSSPELQDALQQLIFKRGKPRCAGVACAYRSVALRLPLLVGWICRAWPRPPRGVEEWRSGVCVASSWLNVRLFPPYYFSLSIHT
jgi:hypothetical protein